MSGAKRVFVGAFAILGLSAVDAWAENPTIVLHAQGGQFECQGNALPFTCTEGSIPTTSVTSGQLWFIYIFIRNYEDAGMVTCRMAVNGGSGPGTWEDWELIGHSFGCVPGQVTSEVPVQNSQEREPGNITTAFNCLTGGALQPLGWVLLRVGSGCLGVEEHQYGTGIIDCQQMLRSVPAHDRGRICVGAGGHNACESGPVPVENETWGQIKAQYR
jgi:hypothetical protein